MQVPTARLPFCNTLVVAVFVYRVWTGAVTHAIGEARLNARREANAVEVERVWERWWPLVLVWLV